MLFAMDEDGYRTHIDDIEQNMDYTCPVCGQRVQIKNKGRIKRPHFAHSKGNCPIENEDMSEWHIRMQRIFPKQCREIVVNDGTDIHRADVLFEFNNQKYVFEFQHSAISRDEFTRRTLFFVEKGCIIYWVFDFSDQQIFPHFYDDENNTEIAFSWQNKRKRFLDGISIWDDGFDFSDDRIHLVFFTKLGDTEVELKEFDNGVIHTEYERFRFRDTTKLLNAFLFIKQRAYNDFGFFYAKPYNEESFKNMFNAVWNKYCPELFEQISKEARQKEVEAVKQLSLFNMKE